MARKLSCTLQVANIYCSSRRRPSLTALPTFDLPPARSESIAPNVSYQPKEREYDAPSSLASVDPDLNSQCYLASNRWLSMNGAFFAERIPLESLGRGLVGEVWYEQARDAEGSIVPLITKLYDYQLPAGTLGLYVELFLYASWDHLRPLQGQCIPTVIGPFSAPGGKVGLLMEPMSPTGWREASMSDSDEIKEKVIAAYAMVHSRGVLHNDVELRHILISNEGNVQIIDWQMAKSIRPNEDVGLNACTQADLDYEARKVEVVLNYRGAYARELELAIPLYEMYARGYPVDKTDPRLGWFPPDELDSMANGNWTEPDVEYIGGRATTTPLLRHLCVGSSRVTTPHRPKCYGRNSHSSKTEQSLGPTSTTTDAGYRTMSDASTPHACDASQANTSTGSDLTSSPSPHSAPEAAQPPATMVVKEEHPYGEDGEEYDEDEDEDEDHQRFIGGRRGAIRHLRASFGFHYCDTARRASKEELAPLGCTRKPVPSGLLLPKFGPSRPSFALSPQFDRQAIEGPEQRELKPLDRHIHWRLTPYAKLAKSHLNPTGSRPDLSSRRNTTLLGSEDFVRLNTSYLPPHTLRPFGAIVPGSTPEQCKVAPPLRTFSEATLQPMYPPPPPRKLRRPKRKMDGILFEESLACYSDSRYMLRQWGADLDKVAAMISRTGAGVGPASPELVTMWKDDLAPLQAFITNCSNLVERKSDMCPADLRARLDHLLSVLPKLKEIKKMIRERSSSRTATRRKGRTTAPKQRDPSPDPLPGSAKTTSETPQSSSSRPPSTQPSRCDEVALSMCPPTTRSEQNITAQTFDQASFPSTPSVVFEPETPKPELSLDATEAIVTVPIPAVLSPPLAAPDVPPSRKSRQRSAPYPERSSRRLRSADNISESPSTSNVDTQAVTKAPRAKRRVPQEKSSLSAIQASATLATATVQPSYDLRPRKRGADEDSTQGADAQLAGPSKRRRSS